LIKTDETTPDTSVRQETLEDGRTITNWHTPNGSIRGATVPSSEANTVFAVEHPIKELKDYEILLSLLESQQFGLNVQNVQDTAQHLDTIGDEGIAYEVAPATPIMDLMRTWVGLEQFTYHLADAPALVESVLDTMAEGYYRQYELIAKHTPCEVIVFWDDANSLYLSPKWFERYSVAVLQRYAELAKKSGKLLVNHTCGKLAALLRLYPKTNADAIDWLTPSPTGDVDPVLAQQILGDQMGMLLALTPHVLRYGSPGDVRHHIRSLLGRLDLRTNVVLMIPAPIGTSLENARAAVQVLTTEFGVPLNRSERYGSLLDAP
jgi:uroporphyrinogen-III decarboxylase